MELTLSGLSGLSHPSLLVTRAVPVDRVVRLAPAGRGGRRRHLVLVDLVDLRALALPESLGIREVHLVREVQECQVGRECRHGQGGRRVQGGREGREGQAGQEDRDTRDQGTQGDQVGRRARGGREGRGDQRGLEVLEDPMRQECQADHADLGGPLVHPIHLLYFDISISMKGCF